MKQFILRSILFLVLLIILVSVFVLGSDFWLKKREGKLLDLKDNITIVFSGDSNVEFSVNDNLVRNSVNIAQSGEAYLYSYAKIKALLKHNKNIRTVLIGFSYHEILKEKEDQLIFSDSYVIEKIKAYNYLLDKEDKYLILRKNSRSYFQGLFQSVYNNLLTCVKSYRSNEPVKKIESFGGYVFSRRDKLNEDIRLQDSAGNDSFRIKETERGLLQEKYLKMISDLCHDNSVRLILLNTPKHSYYSLRINEEIKNNWVSVRNTMPLDSLFDFSSFTLPDSCYGDITHLNYRGAKVFSEYLDGKLNP